MIDAASGVSLSPSAGEETLLRNEVALTVDTGTVDGYESAQDTFGWRMPRLLGAGHCAPAVM